MLMAGDGLGASCFLIGTLKVSWSLWVGKSLPHLPAAQPNRALPGTPAKSVLLPERVMCVFHRGCCDLQNHCRDDALALILKATN